MVYTRTKFLALLLVAFLGVSSAFAGVLSNNQRNYAHEVGNQVLTLGDQIYTMGIDRTIAQDMAIDYVLTGGGAYFAASLNTPVIGGAGTADITYPGIGGIGQTHVKFEIDVTSDFVANVTTITLPAPQIIIPNPAPNTVVTLSVLLKDLYFDWEIDIDTPGRAYMTTNCAVLVPVTRLDAMTDTLTTIDAINVDPATTGFEVEPPADNGDLVNQARAAVQVITGAVGVYRADGAAQYVLSTDGRVTIVVQGDFTGVRKDIYGVPNGFYYDLNNNFLADPGEIFAINGNIATQTFSGDVLGAVHSFGFIVDGITALATRTFAISASLDMITVNPVTHVPIPGSFGAGGQDRSPIAATNSNWWIWNINGTNLRVVYATFSPRNESKFRFINNNSIPVVVKGTIILDQPGATFTLNPALVDGHGQISLTVPAGGSLQVTLCTNPSAGTLEQGPLVTEFDNFEMPLRARVNFLALTETNNVAGQALIPSPSGVVSVVPMVQTPQPGID